MTQFLSYSKKHSTSIPLYYVQHSLQLDEEIEQLNGQIEQFGEQWLNINLAVFRTYQNTYKCLVQPCINGLKNRI